MNTIKRILPALLVTLIFSATAAFAHNDLQLKLGSVKGVYRVGEVMDFTVSANHDFYLYLFTIDQADGNGYLLTPRSHGEAGRLSAGWKHTVPGNGKSLVSYDRGIEKLFVVATLAPLNISSFPQKVVSGETGEVEKLLVRHRDYNGGYGNGFGSSSVSRGDIWIRELNLLVI